jgi:hypothetical protein
MRKLIESRREVPQPRAVALVGPLGAWVPISEPGGKPTRMPRPSGSSDVCANQSPSPRQVLERLGVAHLLNGQDVGGDLVDHPREFGQLQTESVVIDQLAI